MDDLWNVSQLSIATPGVWFTLFLYIRKSGERLIFNLRVTVVSFLGRFEPENFHEERKLLRSIRTVHVLFTLKMKK